MITLKEYQQRTLDALSEFLRDCARLGRPDVAFRSALLRSGQPITSYIPVSATGLPPEMPYVCLRVPTGGGKTLMACHAAGIALRDWQHAERGVVLWLVPSHTILDQTAAALRDPRHPYRRALELACGSVEIATIEEALRLSRASVDAQTVVIVSTIQAFRAEDTTGRKVFAQNGAFSEHFLNLSPERAAVLFPGADGHPKPSLVNMLRLRRPIVIVDEAHNARTELSFTALGTLLPSCILEFTATPAREKQPSNVLHRVSAAELKAAEMIKLPLRVITRALGQQDTLLAEALALRDDLESLAVREAQETGEYLRPILLIQAERVDGCEPLRERLVNEFSVPAEQVKISTGKLDEVTGITDISTPKSPVRVIITVEKLREGWDCPFAQVLCSLKPTRSATAIEQIVGRILRQPGARAKRQPDLNCAYVFSVSDSIHEVLSELRDALVSNGFSRAEAERIILPVPAYSPTLFTQPQSVTLPPATIDASVAATQAEALEGKVQIDPQRGIVTVRVPLSADEEERLVGCVSTPDAQAHVRRIVEQVREQDRAFGGTGKPRAPTPYERQLAFSVPLLCVNEAGNLFEFDSTPLYEYPWKLSEKNAALSELYDPRKRPEGKSGVVDVGEKGVVETKVYEATEDPDYVVKLHQQVLALGIDESWTVEKLVGWLDRKIEHRDIPQGESAEFLRKAIRGLMSKYGIEDLSVIALDRYRFRDEIADVIRQHRESERKAAFKQLLLPGSNLEVRAEKAINFLTMPYEPNRYYDGGFQFKKHYFGPKVGDLEDTLPGGGASEEYRCAEFIDGMAEVEFWVRNIARRTSSFRLMTSSDWFYPDFVCQLKDGRILVVEYKGEHLYSADDAEEKRAVGEVWASRSNGRCLFVMPTGMDFSVITKKVQAK